VRAHTATSPLLPNKDLVSNENNVSP
jgi:hypothetical protein